MADILARFNFYRPITYNLRNFNDTMKNALPGPHICISYSSSISTMERVRNDITYSVYMKGYLSNYTALKEELYSRGYTIIQNMADCILMSYWEWNEQCVHHLEGAYSFILQYDDQVLVSNDAFGQVPLYVSRKLDGEWIFCDEIQPILNEGVRPIFSEEQFMDMLTIGPSSRKNGTLFKNIELLEAGSYFRIKRHYSYQRKYYELEAHDYTKSYEETKSEIYHILNEYMEDNFDAESGILLSGGLDSTLVAGIANAQKRHFPTFSITYENAEADFNENNKFQPSLDNQYIKEAAAFYGITNELFTMKQETLADLLNEAMLLREMPGMADIDSSLLYLLSNVNGKCGKIFTGECADEIFGGYPWFTRSELYQKNTFPWLDHLNYKINLLNDSFIKKDFYKHRQTIYENELKEINTLPTDSAAMKRKRKMMHLSINYFMPTLIKRMAAMNKQFDTVVYLPFANKRLTDIAYNMPLEYYMYGNSEKGILRDTFAAELPLSIKSRKKSPYPKTYSRIYNECVNKLLNEEMKTNKALAHFFDEAKLQQLLKDEDMDIPFYGQLMCGPQWKAYLYQFSKWLIHFNVVIE